MVLECLIIDDNIVSVSLRRDKDWFLLVLVGSLERDGAILIVLQVLFSRAAKGSFLGEIVVGVVVVLDLEWVPEEELVVVAVSTQDCGPEQDQEKPQKFHFFSNQPASWDFLGKNSEEGEVHC